LHLILAAITALFLLFQGITGAIAQQRWSLNAWLKPDAYAVDQVGMHELAPDELLDVVAAADPSFRPAHIMYPPRGSEHAAAIVMGGRRLIGMDMSRNIMVDHYIGSIVAERPSHAGWVGKASALHKWTSMGLVGHIVVIAFALLVIGFFGISLRLAWLTRPVARRFTPLKRWHRSVGIFFAIIFICIAATGLTLNIYDWVESSSGQKVVGQNMMAAMHNSSPQQGQVTLSAAYTSALQVVKGQRLGAFSQAGAHAAQHWFAFFDQKLMRTDILVDPASGELSIYPAGVVGASKVRAWLYPIHTGYFATRIGGLVMTVVGLSVVFWPVSGFILWLRRK
jgi:uncharacterized iron-regulated membrane protein